LGGGGPSGPGGGFAAQNAQLAQELGLTKEQQDRLEAGRRELFQQIQAARQQQQGGGLAGGGGGPGAFFDNNQGQAMRARFDNLMRSVLNPEQLQKWEQTRNARGAQQRLRPGTLWVMAADAKKPEAHDVRLGLADDRYTEIANGDVKEGDVVVTRSRTESKK
jgi:hypothetical protein